jgi:hypothetical protein
MILKSNTFQLEIEKHVRTTKLQLNKNFLDFHFGRKKKLLISRQIINQSKNIQILTCLTTRCFSCTKSQYPNKHLNFKIYNGKLQKSTLQIESLQSHFNPRFCQIKGKQVQVKQSWLKSKKYVFQNLRGSNLKILTQKMKVGQLITKTFCLNAEHVTRLEMKYGNTRSIKSKWWVKKMSRNPFYFLFSNRSTSSIPNFASQRVIENSNIECFWNQCFDKGRLKNFVLWFFTNFGEHKTVTLLENLKNIGFEYATKAGISLGIDDLKIPPKKTQLIAEAEKQTKATISQYKRGEITGVERFQRLIDCWHRTSESLKQEVIQHFQKTDILNPVYMMAFSGARGNISQVRQLVGMRGLMADPQGQILDFPIRSNFKEGLTLTEYIISCYGARKGIVDTALRTANAGYLTRRLVDVAQHVLVALFDCGTMRGIILTDMKEGNKTIYALPNRLVGRVLAHDVDVIGFRNQEISTDLAILLAKKKKRIIVRSPLTCGCHKLVCQLCYGWSLSQGNLVSIGEAVGIIAGQSIGEPGTQLTMRTFHTGGVFSGDFTDQIKAPFDGFVKYPVSIPGTLIRTSEGKIAYLTRSDGQIFVSPFQKSPEVTTHVNVTKKEEKRLDSQREGSSQKTKSFKIPPFTLLFVRNGELIFSKQVIAQISNISKSQFKKNESERCINAELEGEILFFKKFYIKEFHFVLKNKEVATLINERLRSYFLPKYRFDLKSQSIIENTNYEQNRQNTKIKIPVKLQKEINKTLQKSPEGPKKIVNWTSGSVLSGKIYQPALPGNFFPKKGDFIGQTNSKNQKGLFMQIKWFTPLRTYGFVSYTKLNFRDISTMSDEKEKFHSTSFQNFPIGKEKIGESAEPKDLDFHRKKIQKFMFPSSIYPKEKTNLFELNEKIQSLTTIGSHTSLVTNNAIHPIQSSFPKQLGFSLSSNSHRFKNWGLRHFSKDIKNSTDCYPWFGDFYQETQKTVNTPLMVSDEELVFLRLDNFQYRKSGYLFQAVINHLNLVHVQYVNSFLQNSILNLFAELQSTKSAETLESVDFHSITKVSQTTKSEIIKLKFFKTYGLSHNRNDEDYFFMTTPLQNFEFSKFQYVSSFAKWLPVFNRHLNEEIKKPIISSNHTWKPRVYKTTNKRQTINPANTFDSTQSKKRTNMFEKENFLQGLGSEDSGEASQTKSEKTLQADLSFQVQSVSLKTVINPESFVENTENKNSLFFPSLLEKFKNFNVSSVQTKIHSGKPDKVKIEMTDVQRKVVFSPSSDQSIDSVYNENRSQSDKYYLEWFPTKFQSKTSGSFFQIEKFPFFSTTTKQLFESHTLRTNSNFQKLNWQRLEHSRDSFSSRSTELLEKTSKLQSNRISAGNRLERVDSFQLLDSSPLIHSKNTFSLDHLLTVEDLILLEEIKQTTSVINGQYYNVLPIVFLRSVWPQNITFLPNTINPKVQTESTGSRINHQMIKPQRVPQKPRAKFPFCRIVGNVEKILKLNDQFLQQKKFPEIKNSSNNSTKLEITSKAVDMNTSLIAIKPTKQSFHKKVATTDLSLFSLLRVSQSNQSQRKKTSTFWISEKKYKIINRIGKNLWVHGSSIQIYKNQIVFINRQGWKKNRDLDKNIQYDAHDEPQKSSSFELCSNALMVYKNLKGINFIEIPQKQENSFLKTCCAIQQIKFFSKKTREKARTEFSSSTKQLDSQNHFKKENRPFFHFFKQHIKNPNVDIFPNFSKRTVLTYPAFRSFIKQRFSILEQRLAQGLDKKNTFHVMNLFILIKHWLMNHKFYKQWPLSRKFIQFVFSVSTSLSTIQKMNNSVQKVQPQHVFSELRNHHLDSFNFLTDAKAKKSHSTFFESQNSTRFDFKSSAKLNIEQRNKSSLVSHLRNQPLANFSTRLTLQQKWNDAMNNHQPLTDWFNIDQKFEEKRKKKFELYSDQFNLTFDFFKSKEGNHVPHELNMNPVIVKNQDFVLTQGQSSVQVLADSLPFFEKKNAKYILTTQLREKKSWFYLKLYKKLNTKQQREWVSKLAANLTSESLDFQIHQPLTNWLKVITTTKKYIVHFKRKQKSLTMETLLLKKHNLRGQNKLTQTLSDSHKTKKMNIYSLMKLANAKNILPTYESLNSNERSYSYPVNEYVNFHNKVFCPGDSFLDDVLFEKNIISVDCLNRNGSCHFSQLDSAKQFASKKNLTILEKKSQNVDVEIKKKSPLYEEKRLSKIETPGFKQTNNQRIQAKNFSKKPKSQIINYKSRRAIFKKIQNKVITSGFSTNVNTKLRLAQIKFSSLRLRSVFFHNAEKSTKKDNGTKRLSQKIHKISLFGCRWLSQKQRVLTLKWYKTKKCRFQPFFHFQSSISLQYDTYDLRKSKVVEVAFQIIPIHEFIPENLYKTFVKILLGSYEPRYYRCKITTTNLRQRPTEKKRQTNLEYVGNVNFLKFKFFQSSQNFLQFPLTLIRLSLKKPNISTRLKRSLTFRSVQQNFMTLMNPEKKNFLIDVRFVNPVFEKPIVVKLLNQNDQGLRQNLSKVDFKCSAFLNKYYYLNPTLKSMDSQTIAVFEHRLNRDIFFSLKKKKPFASFLTYQQFHNFSFLKSMDFNKKVSNVFSFSMICSRFGDKSLLSKRANKSLRGQRTYRFSVVSSSFFLAEHSDIFMHSAKFLNCVQFESISDENLANASENLRDINQCLNTFFLQIKNIAHLTSDLFITAPLFSCQKAHLTRKFDFNKIREIEFNQGKKTKLSISILGTPKQSLESHNTIDNFIILTKKEHERECEQDLNDQCTGEKPKKTSKLLAENINLLTSQGITEKVSLETQTIKQQKSNALRSLDEFSVPRHLHLIKSKGFYSDFLLPFLFFSMQTTTKKNLGTTKNTMFSLKTQSWNLLERKKESGLEEKDEDLSSCPNREQGSIDFIPWEDQLNVDKHSKKNEIEHISKTVFENLQFHFLQGRTSLLAFVSIYKNILKTEKKKRKYSFRQSFLNLSSSSDYQVSVERSLTKKKPQKKKDRLEKLQETTTIKKKLEMFAVVLPFVSFLWLKSMDFKSKNRNVDSHFFSFFFEKRRELYHNVSKTTHFTKTKPLFKWITKKNSEFSNFVKNFSFKVGNQTHFLQPKMITVRKVSIFQLVSPFKPQERHMQKFLTKVSYYLTHSVLERNAQILGNEKQQIFWKKVLLIQPLFENFQIDLTRFQHNGRFEIHDTFFSLKSFNLNPLLISFFEKKIGGFEHPFFPFSFLSKRQEFQANDFLPIQENEAVLYSYLQNLEQSQLEQEWLNSNSVQVSSSPNPNLLTMEQKSRNFSSFLNSINLTGQNILTNNFINEKDIKTLVGIQNLLGFHKRRFIETYSFFISDKYSSKFSNPLFLNSALETLGFLEMNGLLQSSLSTAEQSNDFQETVPERTTQFSILLPQTNNQIRFGKVQRFFQTKQICFIKRQQNLYLQEEVLKNQTPKGIKRTNSLSFLYRTSVIKEKPHEIVKFRGFSSGTNLVKKRNQQTFIQQGYQSHNTKLKATFQIHKKSQSQISESRFLAKQKLEFGELVTPTQRKKEFLIFSRQNLSFFMLALSIQSLSVPSFSNSKETFQVDFRNGTFLLPLKLPTRKKKMKKRSDNLGINKNLFLNRYEDHMTRKRVDAEKQNVHISLTLDFTLIRTSFSSPFEGEILKITKDQCLLLTKTDQMSFYHLLNDSFLFNQISPIEQLRKKDEKKTENILFESKKSTPPLSQKSEQAETESDQLFLKKSQVLLNDHNIYNVDFVQKENDYIPIICKDRIKKLFVKAVGFQIGLPQKCQFKQSFSARHKRKNKKLVVEKFSAQKKIEQEKKMSISLGSIKQKKNSSNLKIGDFLVFGELLRDLDFKKVGLNNPGQIIHLNQQKITIRRIQPILLSPNAILHSVHGELVTQKTPLMTLPFQVLTTGDIVQGIPKIEEIFEARTTKNGRFFKESIPNLLIAIYKRLKKRFSTEEAVRHSFYKIQQIIIDGIQRVYRSQGVNIADKHIEIIVKQMTSKVFILKSDQIGFLPGEILDLELVEKINDSLTTKILYEPLVLGITKASLEVDSFLSAASFQQTTKVLVIAAITKKRDFLKGLKENVIVGSLIPAGTGFFQPPIKHI